LKKDWVNKKPPDLLQFPRFLKGEEIKLSRPFDFRLFLVSAKSCAIKNSGAIFIFFGHQVSSRNNDAAAVELNYFFCSLHNFSTTFYSYLLARERFN